MTGLQRITTKYFPSITYRSYGSGPALVLIHGFPASGALWREVVFPLSQHNTVIVPDLPGTGESRLEGEATGMEQLAEAIKSVLDDAGFEKAVIGGHSMGGYVALAFGAAWPQRLSGLSLIHSTARADDEEKKATRRKSIELIRKGGREAFVRGMMPNLFAPGFREHRPEVVSGTTEAALGLPGETMIAFYNAMINRPERLEVLQEAAFPVQWVIGEADSVVPKEQALQQTHLSDVSFVTVYPGCGHMSMLEQPERLAADVQDFAAWCAKRKK